MLDLVRRLKSLELFEGLGEPEIQRLATGTQCQELRQGDAVFHAGEPAENIYVVCYGAIKLVRTLPDGEEVIMHFIARGDVFGAVVALREGGAFPLSAFAVEDSAVLKINKKYFRDIWQTHAVLGPRLLNQISKRISDLHASRAAAMASVPQRTAAFLLRTLESQPKDFGNQIAIRLTRQDIANSVGTTVESVIRVLSGWTQKKFVTTTDHRIEILNKDAIVEIARGED